MSHGQSQRYPESRTTQSCPRAVASQATSRGSLRACTNVLHIAPTSVSLPGSGAAIEGTGPRRGFQDRIHRQALSDSGRQASRVRHFDRTDFERDRQSSCVGVHEARAKRWLTILRMVSNGPFDWNTTLIACWLKNLLRLMSCWCPNGADLLISPMPGARRS
jgi:hypothetical protein